MIDNKQEYILCAAIHYEDLNTPTHGVKNIERGLVLCGWRHANIIGQCVSLLGKRQAELGEYTQGFLTNKNRFVNRKEALEIAKANNQLLDENTVGASLFSEDIY